MAETMLQTAVETMVRQAAGVLIVIGVGVALMLTAAWAAAGILRRRY